MRTSEEQRAYLRYVVDPATQHSGATWWSQAVSNLLDDLAEVTKQRDEAMAAAKSLADEMEEKDVAEAAHIGTGGWQQP